MRPIGRVVQIREQNCNGAQLAVPLRRKWAERDMHQTGISVSKVGRSFGRTEGPVNDRPLTGQLTTR